MPTGACGTSFAEGWFILSPLQAPMMKAATKHEVSWENLWFIIDPSNGVTSPFRHSTRRTWKSGELA
jgi:hypothetical protein